MAAPMTEAAIEAIRRLIVSGDLRPGERLPAEADLARELGTSRGTVREAVRALVMARVLDVRRGDGTYVTSLRPELLLQGIGFVVDLIQGESSMEILELRKILEPAATALAVTRATDEELERIGASLERMRAANDHEELVHYDAEFHARVGTASGNQSLASMLEALSSRSIRARVWRGMVEEDATRKTLEEHERIYAALLSRDQRLAQSAALLHVDTTATWLRLFLSEQPGIVDTRPGEVPAPH